ncbi:MAG: hypothetical protein GXO11_08785 [Epsilonproteobacteria bacterium]|nr:hypothetical protein [Campylobacterota bacterium]
MKYISLLLIGVLFFAGCSGNEEMQEKAQPKLVQGKSLQDFELKDQHGKTQKLPEDTKYVIFSFAKPTGHICNEFLESKPANYLAEHHAVYVADVSPAPSLIKKMFILPDLEKLPFPIILINDDQLSAEYSKGMDKESIVVVVLDDLTIKEIKNLHSKEELEKLLNN